MTRPTEPFYTGDDLSVPYRVSSFNRSQRATNAAVLAGRLSTPSAEASRQTRESTTHSTLDQTVRINIMELRFPGSASDVVPVSDRWAYIFNNRTRTCIVEAQSLPPDEGTPMIALARPWRYRYGEITPSTMNSSRAMDLRSTQGIEIPAQPDDEPGDFYVFLSPTRLSRAALEHLLSRLGNAELMAPDRCAFAPVHWTSTYEGVAWVSEPFLWAADTQAHFHTPTVENWIEWTSDEERNHKLFIARTLKQWIDAGITQITNNLEGGQPNAWIRTYERDHNTRRNTAFRAAAYLYHIVNGADHRAVEESLISHGQHDLATVCLHWSYITMGAMATDPGRRYLMSLCGDTARFPARILVHENPPVAWTGWVADNRYAYIAARQLFFNLTPALVELEMVPLNRARADWAAKWRRIRERVGAALERLHRGEMTWRERAIRNELRRTAGAAGAPDAPDSDIPVRPGSGVEAPRRRRVERTFEQLVAASGESIPERYPAADLERLRTRREALGAHGERWTLRLAPFTMAFEIFNLSVAFQAVKDASADESTVDIFGMRARMSTVGMIGASTDALGSIAEFTAAASGRTIAARTASGATVSSSLTGLNTWAGRVAGPLAMVSGTTEMLAHGQAMVDAGWGRGNTAQAISSGTAAVGGALGALGGALTLAGTFLGTSSALGPAGVIIGIVGAVLILVGAALAHFLSRDAYEEFAEFCFLGDSHADETRHGFTWSPSGLPARPIRSETNVLLHMLAAFSITRRGNGGFTLYATSMDPRLRAEISLGMTGDNPILDIEVELKSRGTSYICRMRFRGHAAEMEYYRDINTLILDPAGSAPTRDDHERLTGYTLSLKPAFIIVARDRPAQAPTGDFLSAIEFVKVRARVNLGGGVTAPHGHDFLELNFTDADDGDSANSLVPPYATVAWGVAAH
jgi:hypothetical protein